MNLNMDDLYTISIALSDRIEKLEKILAYRYDDMIDKTKKKVEDLLARVERERKGETSQ
ncbi:hypothetical protein [Paenibacillus bouchesdurhonensis]|uniref:hypothetical protein n=1 Tax=Paenibacillus bouchesdurhonensis TaxID=1870990 RepID=UPI0018FF8A9B|nr:hypothetical protein [Paenibacillus bouchesdurhonensis]